MGHCSPSQYDSRHYSNGGWEYHQENTNSEHSNPWRFASKTQDEQENHMRYFPPPQNDASCYSNECPTSPSSSTFDNSSSPKYVSTQTSTSQRFSELESKFNRLMEEQQQSRRELEILFHETDEQLENTEKCLELLSKENEGQLVDAKENVEEQNEEAFELIEDPLQKSKELLKRQERLMEKQQQSWKEQEILFKEVDEYLEKGRRNSDLLSKEDKDQLVDMKEESEERESKEDTQEKSHSSEVEKCIEEELTEPSLQGTLDEDKTPIITQPPSADIQEVKATNKSTNPVLEPASKLNQAKFKRKLVERKPRKGTVAETSPPLRSFLLTNWKKRKKVKNNMPTVGNVSLPCFSFFLCFV
ncbi:hypothetical protein AHAS_Ahas03G0205500 [Arachis hypogaea]